MCGKEAFRRNMILDRAYKLGFEYEKNFGGCSQCSLAAIQDALNMKNDEVFKAATGLAGGLGATTDGTCGALVGGVMAISSVFGRERNNFKDPEKIRWKTYDLAKRLQRKFVKEYGSSICKDVQKKIFGRSFNLWDEEERANFEKRGAHVDKCPSIVGNVARWATEIILKEKEGYHLISNK